MNSRALGRTSIPLVAIVMMGAMMIVSVIPVAFAVEGNCPPKFGTPVFIDTLDADLQEFATLIDAADGEADDLVCTMVTPGGHTVIVDNNLP